MTSIRSLWKNNKRATHSGHRSNIPGKELLFCIRVVKIVYLDDDYFTAILHFFIYPFLCMIHVIMPYTRFW